MSNTHFVISGNQVASSHPSHDAALAAAVLQGKQGRTVTVVQLVATVAPNVTVTDASGATEVVK